MQNHNMCCPICKNSTYDALYPLHEGTSITSDHAVLPRSSLDNRCCRGCGLIFNAGGTRGFIAEFYHDSYSLMMHNPAAAIQSFSGSNPISQAERSLNILLAMTALEKQGRILEVGAGKGDFLHHFTEAMPAWSITASEPSESFEALKVRLPAALTIRGTYADFQAGAGQFDLVIALGVLEHVENPLDILEWAWRVLTDNGFFFIRVPNFANNPNDLFCADHLSKITVPTIRCLAPAAGFGVVEVKEDGVPIYFLLRKLGAGHQVMGSVYKENLEIARKNVDIARAGIESVRSARLTALERGERFAIFGLGSSGLFAPFYFGFSSEDITAYVDENRSMWGSKVNGRPVGGLDLIKKLNIRHIALAISPVYFAKVIEKLRPFDIKVYCAAT